ncbi:MAG: CrcB protein [Saliniramus fredricksonii]|uniref:Fluoride-specific ion channel FluC n=1 Tax=Saliniramus fredricksonii TaxID=1653334 RepID=A0A0P8BR94_9HYPH|nr:CrcB family protein [Saliniramus fredricksonii]KPQ12049.1 MAG: CrcB protein [Saliniramus fredricksonii]SCC81457.1 camphor resistance protein CrcB [Saliniramus fredricksonii]
MGKALTTLALVALGGALGSVARVLVAQAVATRLGDSFPWGTLVVNVSGALLIGALLPLLAEIQAVVVSGSGSPAVALLIVGLVGSYTTVSSFSLQTIALLEEGSWRAAVANLLASVALCLGAVFVASRAVAALMGVV